VTLFNRIGQIKLVPVIKIEDLSGAIPLADALIKGGLSCAEITFRTSVAPRAIENIRNEFPQMLIGAGTVLNPDQAATAVKCGADFIVTPGFNEKVVSYCCEKDYPVLPGVCTPTEIETALSFGLKYLKFFPAEICGGVNMIRTLSAPYPTVRFMPTGGVSLSNVTDYLSCKSVFACGGSWMVPAYLLNSGDFDGIMRLTAEAVAAVKA